MNKKQENNEEKEKSVKTGDQDQGSLKESLLITPQKSKPREAKTTQKSQNKFQFLTIDALPLDFDKKSSNKYTGCNCRKSYCLKMYCVCFTNGKMCDDTCLCQTCRNKTDNISRSEAINQIITRDPFAFSKARNAKLDLFSDGCNCKRSNCSKKYCECFRNGKGCNKKCNCVDCQNVRVEEQGSPVKKAKLQPI